MIVSGDTLTGNTTGKVNSNSPLSLPSGSVSAPALSFTSDSDSGLYNPAPDNLGFVTGGTEKLRVDGDGQQSSVVPGGNTLLPLFGCRAWVNFHGVQSVTGSYTRTGNVVTVTHTSHGMSTGFVANLSFAAGTGGTATAGTYSVTVVNANTYTVVDSASGTITSGGNVTRNTFIRAAGNVSSVTRSGTGDYTVNFTTPMPDNNYCPFIGSHRSDSVLDSGGAVYGGVYNTFITTSNIRVVTQYQSSAGQYDAQGVFVTIFR